jgi:hypothetical protein
MPVPPAPGPGTPALPATPALPLVPPTEPPLVPLAPAAAPFPDPEMPFVWPPLLLVEPEAPPGGGCTEEEPGSEQPNPSSTADGRTKNEGRINRMCIRLSAERGRGHENAAVRKIPDDAARKF